MVAVFDVQTDEAQLAIRTMRLTQIPILGELRLLQSDTDRDAQRAQE